MAKSTKKAKKNIAKILSKKLENQFALLSQSKIWISQTMKNGDESAHINQICQGVDIDALSESFNYDEADSCFFNVWMKVEKMNETEINELTAHVAKQFHGSSFYLGTKYPYTSKDGNSISFRILPKG